MDGQVEELAEKFLTMNFENFRHHCLLKKGVTESFPFGKKPTLLVFKVMGKMFASAEVSEFEFIRIKFPPEDVQLLRDTYPEVTPPQYANPKHWNNVSVLGGLKDELIKKWIDDSYELVKMNLTKKQKEELGEM